MASRFTSSISRTRAHNRSYTLFAFTTFTNSRVTHRITKKYEGNRNGVLVFLGKTYSNRRFTTLERREILDETTGYSKKYRRYSGKCQSFSYERWTFSQKRWESLTEQMNYTKNLQELTS